MSDRQELAVRDKQELATKEEKTAPGRYFIPATDIFETDEVLAVILEMPGVQKSNVEVALENDVLRVDAKLNLSDYEGLEPVYTEYNIGHYTRSFAISSKIDRDNISAQLDNGVLTLTLPKVKEALPRRIALQ